jgi:glutathione synthase/RimK-type ligase-like ATP-grasp enzyme
MGVPDDARAKLVYSSWKDVPRTVMQGSASFLGQLTEPPWQLQSVYFGAPQLALPAQLRRLPCINFLADADLYPRALHQAQAFVRGMGTPCFNTPEAVLGTTRDQVHMRLKDVPGLHVPVTVRARASRLAQLQAAMARAGIDYPVLVRMAGDHGGVSTALVHDAGDWEALNPLPWGGRDVYLTQFVDYRDADGRYRKTRLVVVGDTAHTRHLIVSASWMVHRKERLAGTEDEERAWLDGFATHTLPRIAPAIRALARRLGLDYFGIDCSLRPDGTLLIFEANACMNVLARTSGEGPTMWDASLAGIRGSLDRVLGDVRQWRSLRAPAGASA